MDDQLKLSSAKKEIREKNYERFQKLFSPDIDDDEIIENIMFDIEYENNTENNKFWLQVSSMQSSSIEKLMLSALSSLRTQNNIIIRQNELILRQAKKQNDYNDAILKELKKINNTFSSM